MKGNKRQTIFMDEASMRILKVLDAISTTLFSIGIVMFILEPNPSGVSAFALEAIAGFSLFALLMGGFITIACSYMLLAGTFYFRRLRAYGYTIPKKRKDYDNLLANVPKIADATTDSSLFVRDSRILFYVNMICFVAFLALDIRLLIYWRFMKDSVGFVFVPLLLLSGVCLIYALIARKQENPSIYRDDVAIDDTKKARCNLIEGLKNCVVLIIICLGINTLANDFIEYMFKTQIQSDEETLGALCNDIRAGIREYFDLSGLYVDATSEETFSLLIEGVDITELVNQDSELADAIARNAGGYDILKETYKFHCADGEPKIRVINQDGTVTCELVNTVEEVYKYGYRSSIITATR